MPRYLLLGFSRPTPGREAEYDAWAAAHHVPETLDVPGIVSAERFALSDLQRTVEDRAYTRLTVYEVETDDLAATLGELQRRGERMTPTASRDPAFRSSFTFTSIAPKVGREGPR